MYSSSLTSAGDPIGRRKPIAMLMLVVAECCNGDGAVIATMQQYVVVQPGY